MAGRETHKLFLLVNEATWPSEGLPSWANPLAITFGFKAVRGRGGSIDLLMSGSYRARVHTQGLLRVLLTTPTAVEWRLGKCTRKCDGVGGGRERDDCYKVEEHDKLRPVGGLKKECGDDLAAWAIKNAIYVK